MEPFKNSDTVFANKASDSIAQVPSAATTDQGNANVNYLPANGSLLAQELRHTSVHVSAFSADTTKKRKIRASVPEFLCCDNRLPHIRVGDLFCLLSEVPILRLSSVLFL